MLGPSELARRCKSRFRKVSTVLRYPTIDCQWSVPAGQVSCECKEAKFNLSEEWRPAHCWCNSKNECACHMLPYPYRLSLALAAAGTVRSGIHLKMRPKQVERHQANEYDTMKCSPLAEIPEVVWLRWLPRSSPKRALIIALSHNIDVYTMGQMPMAIVN